MANRGDVVQAIAEATQLSKKDAENAFETLIDYLTQALKREEKVTISGFGAFSAGHRAARTGRNPRTGDSVAIPASKVPRFKAAKVFKDAVQ
ncbi:MAG: HU family DNA-binding protein [Candidatus Latescibacteria bacterium]|nr:HU family DNA-binding protein [Candidatus Latescibacterota bacterium]